MRTGIPVSLCMKKVRVEWLLKGIQQTHIQVIKKMRENQFGLTTYT